MERCQMAMRHATQVAGNAVTAMRVGRQFRLAGVQVLVSWNEVWAYPGELEGLLVQVAVLLAALPTATSAYILARQLGGDAPLMAGIISGQTLLAMVSIPVLLSLLW